MTIDEELKVLKEMGEMLKAIHKNYEALESKMLKYKLALSNISLGQLQMPSVECFARHAVSIAKTALKNQPPQQMKVR